MYIHQEPNDTILEGWINLDMITYIGKKHTGIPVLYECYIVGDKEPLTITKETLDKILMEKGWV